MIRLSVLNVESLSDSPRAYHAVLFCQQIIADVVLMLC